MDDATEAAHLGTHRRPLEGDLPGGERLTPKELRMLQLLARGYSADQLAALHGGAPLDVLWDLQRVLVVLGAPTVRGAVAEAKRRGLLV